MSKGVPMIAMSYASISEALKQLAYGKFAKSSGLRTCYQM